MLAGVGPTGSHNSLPIEEQVDRKEHVKTFSSQTSPHHKHYSIY